MVWWVETGGEAGGLVSGEGCGWMGGEGSLVAGEGCGFGVWLGGEGCDWVGKEMGGEGG